LPPAFESPDEETPGEPGAPDGRATDEESDLLDKSEMPDRTFFKTKPSIDGLPPADWLVLPLPAGWLDADVFLF